MNSILKKVKQIVNESINKYLPDVKSSDLEGNGTVYYMNGRNGTEFDWYVNDHISDFMVFYNDEKNLGALKLTLYNNGNIIIYIYGDKGNKLIRELESSIKVSEKEMLELAVILKYEADDKKIFNNSIDKIDSDVKISQNKINEFINEKKYFEKMRARQKLFNLKAIVSTKITKEGYKVGYMVRDNPRNNMDSGWQFLAGNEDEDYLNNVKNIELLPVAYICNLDSDIEKYIDSPVGAEFIRVSSSEFEIDNHDREIYIEKRNCNEKK